MQPSIRSRYVTYILRIHVYHRKYRLNEKICEPKDLTLIFVIGTGDSTSPNWYYKSDDSKCTAFLFTGSEGNANRFETQEQCERQCGEFKNQVKI